MKRMSKATRVVMIGASATTISATLAATLAMQGCNHPLQKSTQDELRQQLIASHTAYLDAVAAGPVIELSRPTSDLTNDLSQQRRDELNKMGGPDAYKDKPLRIGTDLLTDPGTADDTPDQENLAAEEDTVYLSLRDAIHLAAKNNLDVASARIIPGVNQTQITQAESNFDAVLFADLNYNKTDTPRPSSLTSSIGGGALDREDLSVRTGIRKRMTTGGVVEVATTLQRLYENPSLFSSSITGGPFKYYNASVETSVVQPLLRNFGTDINRTEILLTENVRASSLEDLRQTLMERLFQTEQAYWELVFARYQLQVAQSLLERGIGDMGIVKAREEYTVSPVEVTQTIATVGDRRSRVIVAKQSVRDATDRLKLLINSKELSISGETLIIPTDTALDLPVQVSLLDSVTIALRQRPIMQQSLLSIDSATLRQRFFDNQRLPQLNLSLTARYNGIGTGSGRQAYADLGDGNFIDYLIGAQFEVPIGNRGPEAAFRQRVLEREQTVIDYQRAAQSVVVEVKSAMRQMITRYQLIGSTRDTRLAASDNLRAIEVRQDAGEPLTFDFIDFKLRRQDALANAEIDEMRSIVDYNIAIAAYYQTLGTLLDHNSIAFNQTADTDVDSDGMSDATAE